MMRFLWQLVPTGVECVAENCPNTIPSPDQAGLCDECWDDMFRDAPAGGQDTYSRYIYNFRDQGMTNDSCGCGDSASWPTPRSGNMVSEADDLVQAIARCRSEDEGSTLTVTVPWFEFLVESPPRGGRGVAGISPSERVRNPLTPPGGLSLP